MVLLKAASMHMPALRLFIGLLPTLALANSQWTLTSTTLDQSSFEVQPYVANGYISQRIPVEGFGYKEIPAINATAMDGTSGWPLFDTRFTAAMIAGFYDQQATTTGTNFVRLSLLRLFEVDSLSLTRLRLVIIILCYTGPNWRRTTHIHAPHLVIALPHREQRDIHSWRGPFADNKLETDYVHRQWRRLHLPYLDTYRFGIGNLAELHALCPPHASEPWRRPARRVRPSRILDSDAYRRAGRCWVLAYHGGWQRCAP